MGQTKYNTGDELRRAARKQEFSGQTSGYAQGYVQGNLVILPTEWAFDFAIFAQRNPKPCPLIEVGEIGDPYTRFCARHVHIRTDIPKYHVYRNGKLSEELLDGSYVCWGQKRS